MLLVGEPAGGVALLSFRLNAWYQGPVAILDELYVGPGLRSQRPAGRVGAPRFYEARGLTNAEPNGAEPMLYYYLEP